MTGINMAIVGGNLGADPELRHTGGGTAVANFNVASNSRYTNRDGDVVEKTEWHRVVAWDRLAENVAEYLKKGSRVLVIGSIQTRQWEDEEGRTRYTTEIKADRVQFLDAPNGDGNGERSTGYKGKRSTKQMADPDDGGPF